ncbi:hypothetical protein G6L37_33200 [Agrobacterium rubi]|uniref:Beta-ketoacyl synthase N-terminal domain-containing protein n=1 Tax=Agrobacterium rubi TR3 = NBRC 13261 TaxID=1368415 RepID=A0A081D133_9HYPH|nr:hypothetical protein [Agrobacterium rubi]MBP1880458.1 3-oxoacyl-[acyl-carrier-protein] synthase-1 [Agrobacterium rubi]NTF10831.1 hypothetical protein [Agrobacterium rubi]NTF23247.1 hypothetical protein [Agrobacterium rubi]NTF30167.1 hypothetical protein [Agrobacterium rubi]GAK72629.1 hypothetical protein RRU01S_27_00170 [Agrobacterium rubi TR3 = NBRC 13261]
MNALAGIVGVGISCPLGQGSDAVRRAYVERVRNFVRSSQGPIGFDGQAITLSCVMPFEEVRDYDLRIRNLFAAAFDDLAAQVEIDAPVALRLVVPAWLGRHDIGAGLQTWVKNTYSKWFSSVSLLSGGDTIALYEVAKALKELRDENGGGLIVGALDSFMDAELLDMLAVNGRLFSRGNPHGLIPAEAAVLVMLELPGELRQALPVLGTMRSVFTGFERENLLAPDGVIGRGLAKPLRQAFETFSPARFLVDLNGERWRSEDLGFALSGARVPDKLLADFETPIAFTGDCGAANSLIMATVAIDGGQSGPPDQAEDQTAGVSILSIALPQGPRCVAVFQSLNKHGMDS